MSKNSRRRGGGLADHRSYCMLSPICIGMHGSRSTVQSLVRNQPSRQPSTISGMGNEYPAKVRWRSKGRHDSFHLSLKGARGT